MLRPAPGQQVSSGRLRVDAAKAIAKLREYQLVDRTAWVLEAIRAAVAAKATSIELRGDSNDVWLSWAGAPWPAEDLPRLFDELVSPEPGAERHHMRLLAAAVNSALGANPAYIDVYAVGEQVAMRARYTPDVLVVAGDLDDSPLRNLRVTPATPPIDVPLGMLVHYRRRASLGVLSNWLSQVTPELALARSACIDITTPLRIGGTQFDRAKHHTDIVRVPLGSDLDGFVAIVNPTAGGLRRYVSMHIAERGVLLENTPIDLGLPELRSPIPLRVVLDGPRMPTNASRSEVRRDAHPIAPAMQRARAVVPELIGLLVEKLSPVQMDPQARLAAIHLIASMTAGVDWTYHVRQLEPPMRALVDLPLVRDAAGVPRPINWSWNGLVYRGSSPLDEELAPWLSQVLWAPPGDPTILLTSGWSDQSALRQHLKIARRTRRDEKKFFKHTPREAKVLGRKKPRVRARLNAPLPDSCMPDSVFYDLRGEVCVYRDGNAGELVILLQGRQIETATFDSPIAFAAAIDSPRLRPADRFRGVVRDTEYYQVERAMRAGVVRAIESVALAYDEKFVDGYQVAIEKSDSDAAMIRHGILLARSLGPTLSPAFEHAPIWRTTSGDMSIAELRTHGVLGVVGAHADVAPLPNRVIVYCRQEHRALLADVVRTQWVEYTPDSLSENPSASELAVQLLTHSSHALALREDDLVAAIAPSNNATLSIAHRGVKLADLPYVPTLAPCTIAIDSDAVIPDANWRGLVDDAGLAKRTYAEWERKFLCEVARAIVGEPSQDLVGGGHLEFTSTAGKWFSQSIFLHANPKALLGEDLWTRLRTCSLFRLLGDMRRLYSIDELAVKFPDSMLFVQNPVEPVAGFDVVLADQETMRTIGKIASRRFRNAEVDLALKRSQIARDLRLGEHRMKPRTEVIAPYGGVSVAVKTPVGQGVVGVGRERLEIDVLFEGRSFQKLDVRNDVPLAAVFELDSLGHTDGKFEAIRPDVLPRITDGVRAMGPELLVALAKDDPNGLAEPGPRRTLLAEWIGKRQLPPNVGAILAETVKFPTLHGERATVAEARRGTTILVTSWHGEWLAADGDADPALDRPIVYLGNSSELGVILGALGAMFDVTADVERLQARRQIARGLLPTPTVLSPSPGTVMKLSEFGPAYRHLGPGEIALTTGLSQVLVHALGQLREQVPFNCSPTIQLAIEAPDLVNQPPLVEQRIGSDARQLARELARRVLAKQSADTLPVEIRRSLRTAILSGELDDVRDAAVFETVTGAWIDLAAVQAQRELFGNLWCVPAIPTEAQPLDDRRIVLVLSGEQMLTATQHGIPIVDATTELALDAKTRKNRAKERLDKLSIPREVLAHVELLDDNGAGPRGLVGVLAPNQAHFRTWWLSHNMHPFEPQPDQCRWPTVVAIDEPNLTPDRCWAAPERDDVYKAVVDRIHKASNEALRNIVPIPANALASIRVAPWTYDTVAVLRTSDIQIRGALWLDGPPLAELTPVIRVVEAGGERKFVPLRGIGLTGTLYVHATRTFKTDEILEQLCAAIHGKLVREIAFAGRRDPDLVAAHVAWAMALDRITAEEAKQVKFACFRPFPLEAAALEKVLKAKETVVIVRPESRYTELALVDDGSHTSRIIKAYLGMRLRSPAARQRPDTVEPPPPPAVVQHPLQPFVNALHQRIKTLGIAVPAWRIVDGRTDPVVSYSSDGVLELGASHPHILAAASTVAANTAWARDVLDAIAAHCVTVLNVALTSITDAAEGSAIARLLT